MISLHRKPIGTVGIMDGVMSVPSPFSWSLMQMMLYSQHALCDADKGDYILPDHAGSANGGGFSLHDMARNHLTMRMRGEWLFMLDTDIAFEPDLLARLLMYLNRYELDIVSAVYCQKSIPHLPVAYMWNPDVEIYEQVGQWDDSQDVVRVDSVGAGALLIRRRVFERIRDELNQNPFDRLFRNEAGPNERANLMGEDQSFFTRCRKLGIQAWIAPKVHAYHLAYNPIDPASRPQVDTHNTYASKAANAILKSVLPAGAEPHTTASAEPQHKEQTWQ